MYLYKSLFYQYKNARPESEVKLVLHPDLDIHTESKKYGKQTTNACPLIAILTNKKDYDGVQYQDFVLYDSTGEGPIYTYQNYDEKKSIDKLIKAALQTQSVKWRVSYLVAQCID